MCLHFYIIQLANLHTLFLQDSELSADESHGHGRARGRGIGRGGDEHKEEGNREV